MTEQELRNWIVRFIQNSVFFDDRWYRAKYRIPDTTWAAGHYFLDGWKLDFDPSEYFSTREYLESNQDVLKAGMNPLFHYERFGKHENSREASLRKRVDRVLGNNQLHNHRIDNHGLLRIRITNRCNGRCRYCGLRLWSQEEQQREMDPQWYYEYCKPLYDKINIVLITGGDAFFAKESYNYMAFLSKNYPKITIATESNGIGFSENFREIACENLCKTHFSINASNGETFVKGCWDGPNGNVAHKKSLENIKAYLELLKEKNRLSFAPNLSMVINKDTAHDVVDFTKLALSMHASSINFYFDYTENNMESPNFSNPETSRRALKQLMEMERVLAGRIHLYFRLWIPYEEPGRLQPEVDAVPLSQLNERYSELLELAKDRSMTEEFEQRNMIRMENGKRPLTMEEDYSPTIRMTDVGGKSVCFAAWSELDLYPNGRIDFCGWYRPTLNIKDYIKNDKVDWNDILDSNDYKICRRNILNDNFTGCLSSCPMNSCSSEIVSPFKYGLEREMRREMTNDELNRLRSEREIVKSWKGDLLRPLLSIGCITYNQEKYIQDALKGFLIQETDFPFEILIHDDASTDRTADIIREYEKRYPNLIKAVYQTENQYSKGTKPLINFVLPRVHGRYVALCEGDDYWTDPLKLQKQVDFLESHQDCSMCFHPVTVKHENSSRPDYIFPNAQTHSFIYLNAFTELKHLIPFNYIQTNSVMYRWHFNHGDLQRLFPRNILPGDWFLHLLHAEKGKIGLIDQVMAVYRRHSGGVWWDSGHNQEKFLMQNGMAHLACYQAIEERWPEQVTDYSKQISTRFTADVIRVFLKNRNLDALEKLKQQFPEYNKRASSYLASLNTKSLSVVESEPAKSRTLGISGKKAGISAQEDDPKPGPIFGAPTRQEEVIETVECATCHSSPLVSIIIPLFNKVEFTHKCLQALFQNTPVGLYELIIIDNASTDGTGTFLQGLVLAKNDIKVLTNEKNLGFAKACNQGARAASTEYLVFLNNDTEPLKGWLEPLLDVVKEDDSVAAVGSKLLYPDMTIQHAGVVIVDDRAKNDPLLARHNHINKPSTAPEANEAIVCQALTAACLLVRRKDFQLIKAFDEEYWNGYEDIDLCFKLQMHGKKLVYQPASVVIHHESQSGPERFVKAKDNIRRLHEKWLNKIKPDFIVQEDGRVTLTDAKKISLYRAPEVSQIPTSAPVIEGLVSIIILTFNQIEYTKKCVASIRKYTPEPHEIIFVDNGSTDVTLKWVRTLVKENQNYKVIENGRNLGFAKGCNQGIEASQGEFILLLNNDVLVTKDWLAGLVHCLDHSPNVGIVGPMTNNISGPQRVVLEGYRSVDDLDSCAAAFRERYRHRRIPFRRIVGFCMLFRRTLADQIGLLDESFGTGNFEDDDYCLRAVLAGYQNYIAGDVFILHYGSRSFIGNKIDYSTSIQGNIKIFDEKWTGLDLRTDVGKKFFAINTIDKAHKFYQIGNIDKAIDALIEGIKHAPEEKKLYYHLAEMLLDAQLYKDAFDAVDSLPQNTKNELRYLEIVARCKCGLGESGDYIDRLISADKNSSVALTLRGMEAYRRGDLGAAEDFFEEAIAADPRYAWPYTNLGILMWASGEDEEALDYLEKGFILSPTATEHVELYHSAVTETGQLARAEGFVRDAVLLYPENKRILFFLIDILIKQGKYDAAMDEIEKAMLTVGIDDGMLAAALEIRNRVGMKEIDKAPYGKGTLSLCMIVKNEEKHLARCLLSVKSVVDEMIVVDTGSTDRTGDIAKAFGAKVFDYPWSNDFSAARNHSLFMAAGDWILVLDADEVISELDHPALRKIVQKKHSKPVAYAMVTRNYTNEVATRGWTANDRKYRKEEAGTGWFPSRKVRLFPNSEKIRFQNPVHELVEASVQKSGLEIRHVDIPVHHYGRFDKDKLLMKGKEYFLLGMRKLEEMKGDQKALRELAIQASELKEYETAVDLWKKVIERDPNDAGAHLNISYAYLKLEKYQEGLISSRRATELDQDMKEAALNYADAEFIIGDVRNTISVLEKVLQKDPDYPPAIALLAAALYTTGQRDAGSSLFDRLRKKGFHCAEFLHLHCEGAISQGREDQAIMLLQAAVDSGFITEDTQRLLNHCKRAAVTLTTDEPVALGTAVSQAHLQQGSQI